MPARWCIGFLCLVISSCSAPESGRVLSFERLMSGAMPGAPIPMSEFAATRESGVATNTFSGRLILETGDQQNHFELLHDEFGLVTLSNPGVDRLPPFDMQFVQDGEYLVPMVQGPIDSGHAWWDLVLRPGRVWDEPGDKGFSRAAIPFALKERREDCIHNGVLTFVFDDRGEISRAAFQVSQQTCRYMKFAMHGILVAEYESGPVPGSGPVVSRVKDNRENRLPTFGIGQLAEDYPGSDPAEFGSAEEIAPEDMTVYGFVIEDRHYTGGCATPLGAYPYCDDMALPSYSTAKSLVGGLGLMLMEAKYPGTASASIGELVPECGASWNDVTIEHALDMTTGHFDSSELHADENSGLNSSFFNSDSHEGKVDFACNEYPRNADPGEYLVYRSWDTYLAGRAMNLRFKSLVGQEADFYSDLIVRELWDPLGLSLLARATRRTYDDVAQPFTGFGLTFVRDDVAKLMQFIGPSDGRLNGRDVLDRRLFDAIKQRIPDDPGMVAELDTIRYNNGFRSFDVSSYIGCDGPVWVVVLSGFGGIIFAVMPNDTAYYYFSDGDVHRYLHAVRESHRIRPMCAAGSAEAVQ